MENVRYSVGNDLVVIRKFNDGYYTETLIKGYYHRQRNFKEYDWQLFGGQFKNCNQVTRVNVNGFDYFGDSKKNLLHDKDGQIRLYKEYKSIEHSDERLCQSISRSKRNILELAMCNDWDFFGTITINPDKYDRTNVELLKNEWRKFIKSYNQRLSENEKIRYVLVPEYHKDKKNIHFHGFIKGGKHDDYFINNNGYLDFEPIANRFGFCSFSKIRSHNKISVYITKYINKELALCVGLGKQCYLCSKGLKRPTVIIQGDNISVGDNWSYENDHIKKAVYYDDSFLTQLEFI